MCYIFLFTNHSKFPDDFIFLDSFNDLSWELLATLSVIQVYDSQSSEQLPFIQHNSKRAEVLCTVSDLL